MATETTEKVTTLDKVLNKIDAFFEGLMSAKKEDDEAPDADDEPEAVAEPAPAADKKATDDEDSQDPDDDGDDDTDPDKDDDMDMKKDAEIKSLKSMVAQQSLLLKEAKTQLEKQNKDVREEIKSTFKPAGSQRSTKVGTKAELPTWAQPATAMGKNATKMAVTDKK